MADKSAAEPVKPPPGGYNDFFPPPPPESESIDQLAQRIRSGDRPGGAAWRLCTLTQPRSIQELIAHVWTAQGTPVPKDVGLAIADAFADWVDAGKPVARPRT